MGTPASKIYNENGGGVSCCDCVKYEEGDSTHIRVESKYKYKEYAAEIPKDALQQFWEYQVVQVVFWDAFLFGVLLLVYFFDGWLKKKTRFGLIDWIHKIRNRVLNGSDKDIRKSNNLQAEAISGKYEYKCVQSDNKHQHGGTCKISAEHLDKGYFVWTLSGKRTWRSDDDTAKKEHTDPFPWRTSIASITKDNEFLFSFSIEVDGQSNLGFAEGIFEVNEETGIVQEMNGVYYQRAIGKIVDGKVYFKRVI